MQVVRRSLWIYIFLFTLHWGQIPASASSLTLPAPELDIYLRSEDLVGLVCRAPEGHHGVEFMLYQNRTKVDSQELQSGAGEARFTVRVKKSVQLEPFCCLYKNQEDAAPSPSTPFLLPPVLSVQPAADAVKRGDVLSFSCSLPSLLDQSEPQSSYSNKPVNYLLLWTATSATGVTSIVLQPQASQIANPEPQPGVFTVGPVKDGEEGEYTCLYQITKNRSLFNSTVSNSIQITITGALPVPTLVFQRQTEVWHLLCTGSPAYPGAVFSLYLTDNEFPVATHHAIHHQVSFPVPVQDTPEALYQCQYSVLLGRNWRTSERSLPLAVTAGTPTQPSPEEPGADWPLILGTFSAVVVFLCSVVIISVTVLRKVKAAAEEKKKRQDTKFWTHVHNKDHIVDLPLRHISETSQEWTSMETTDTPGRFPLQNTLSTFTTPIHPIY
ncbi:uncharacterized protein [Antennarius striatus]|uniref:uncharacterized protein isoform X2 n=1 Tax=Antennarius striatus TaxID=241820 RepID=UPI0035B04D5B